MRWTDQHYCLSHGIGLTLVCVASVDDWTVNPSTEPLTTYIHTLVRSGVRLRFRFRSRRRVRLHAPVEPGEENAASEIGRSDRQMGAKTAWSGVCPATR